MEALQILIKLILICLIIYGITYVFSKFTFELRHKIKIAGIYFRFFITVNFVCLACYFLFKSAMIYPIPSFIFQGIPTVISITPSLLMVYLVYNSNNPLINNKSYIIIYWITLIVQSYLFSLLMQQNTHDYWMWLRIHDNRMPETDLVLIFYLLEVYMEQNNYSSFARYYVRNKFKNMNIINLIDETLDASANLQNILNIIFSETTLKVLVIQSLGIINLIFNMFSIKESKVPLILLKEDHMILFLRWLCDIIAKYIFGFPL
jgi:hypothetical protein